MAFSQPQPGAPCNAGVQVQSESWASLWPFMPCRWESPISTSRVPSGEGHHASDCLVRSELPVAKGIQAKWRKDSCPECN